jgi:hypothetical protein
MSQATRAKSAKSRATIAIRMLKTQKTLGRSFDDCFEMFDGDKVKAIILERAKTDYTLLVKAKEFFNWPELGSIMPFSNGSIMAIGNTDDDPLRGVYLYIPKAEGRAE